MLHPFPPKRKLLLFEFVQIDKIAMVIVTYFAFFVNVFNQVFTTLEENTHYKPPREKKCTFFKALATKWAFSPIEAKSRPEIGAALSCCYKGQRF